MRGTVVIVDDEPLIRRGLGKMIEESPVQWQVVGEAENGEEALRLVDGVRPDLVITDIRMPVMGGLTLCERLWKSGGPDVMILTAHKDFEFAQQALRFGAIDFVLKPCSMEELTRSLEKAYRIYEAKRERLEREEASRRVHFEHDFRSLLLGLRLEAEGSARLSEACAGRELIICKVETYMPIVKDYRREDEGLLQFALHNVMRELFGQHGLDGCIVTVKRDVFAVLAAPSPETAPFAAALRRLAAELLGLTVVVEPFGGIPLERMNGLVGGADAGDGAAGPDVESLERSKTIQAELLSFLRLGRTNELREYLERFAQRTSRLDAREAKLEALGLVMALSDVGAKEFGAEREGGADAGRGDLGEWIAALHPIRTPAAVGEWLAAPVAAFAARMDAWLAGRNAGVLERALVYIERHYAGNCTIHEAARFAHLSVSYFSNQFKKESGDTFTNYLTKFRMEKAQILLSNTQMKITEIAEAVGYADPNYFTTVFRQTFGCSPSEYRKQRGPQD